LIPMSANVTYGLLIDLAPRRVRTSGIEARPSATHSGHWKPTDALIMQSGQIGRSHRVHRM